MPHETDDPFADAVTTLASGFDPTSLPVADFALVVDSGPDAGLRATVAATAPGPTLLGQSAACSVRLRDVRVSRRHATLEVVGARVRLVDLGSTNGTRVGPLDVADVWLRGGEPVQVGDTVFHVEPERGEKPIEPPAVASFGRVLGASLEMRRLYPLCERLAASLVPIVIEGETGTGKEVLAESLHECSPRASMPFVVFDCTTLAPSLAEAELFGHEKGAFTGAVGARRGVFEQAHGGTLFIDEIGDLDPSIQPKLLRAVERGEIRRVGSERVHKVDVRIIAATRRNLDEAVSAGRFRDDLYHRLMVGRIELPPLRQRRGDIALLAARFWSDLGGAGPLPEDLRNRWERDLWSGNVRSLRNAVARHIALGNIEETSRPSERNPGTPSRFIEDLLARNLPLAAARQVLITDFEKRYIEDLLAKHGGDTARAAAASGIARRYFNLLRARHRDV